MLEHEGGLGALMDTWELSDALYHAPGEVCPRLKPLRDYQKQFMMFLKSLYLGSQDRSSLPGHQSALSPCTYPWLAHLSPPSLSTLQVFAQHPQGLSPAQHLRFPPLILIPVPADGQSCQPWPLSSHDLFLPWLCSL